MSYFPCICVFLICHSASLPSLFALAGRSPPWKGLEPRFFIFLTFPEIWLFLLIFPSICSQTTIQSNSSSPLTEEPSVDSAGFQISWLSIISQLPALSFYSVAYFSLSPGMVMQLHSFLQEHPDATMEQIDNILDGNLCRWIA